MPERFAQAPIASVLPVTRLSADRAMDGDNGYMFHITEKGRSHNALMIGDTDHDHEVGTAMGVDVLLVAHGHQNYERLRAVHHLVIDTI